MLLQKFYLQREDTILGFISIQHWTLSLYIPISYDLPSEVVWQLIRQLEYHHFIKDAKYSFTSVIKDFLKCWKAPKYYSQDCLKISILVLYTLINDCNLWRCFNVCSKKSNLSAKTPLTEAELHFSTKIRYPKKFLQKTFKIGTFFDFPHFISVWNVWENHWSYSKQKYVEVWKRLRTVISKKIFK